MVSSAAGPTLTQPTSYQFQPISTACFQQTPTETNFASRHLAKEGAIPFTGFLNHSTNPPISLPLKMHQFQS